ncbi:hypothetical protein A8990_15827 [Paenibacillus taihuensis]|uniref:Glycosyl hydrolase family 32 n=1 Tax=Paenibacillus taihuensis TaxID=1156355 RepID=A0A3D9Q242_9BACL|nr:GH32 C-terminal domain-containing protein [Paenibacillus taihuensis]REE56490.1 hypothetical protein A8990_15827 [Paenibacillus taihuensis]
MGTALNSVGELIDFYYEQESGQWLLEYLYVDGSGAGVAVSRDLVHWHEAVSVGGEGHAAHVAHDAHSHANANAGSPRLVELQIEDSLQSKWLRLHENHAYEIGDWDGERFTADGEPAALWTGIDSERLAYGQSRCVLAGLIGQVGCGRQLVLAELKLRRSEQGIVRLYAEPVAELRNLRVWQREWSVAELSASAPFKESLQFRVAPGEWLDIQVLPVAGEPDDSDKSDTITSNLLDVQLVIEAEEDYLQEIELYGIRVTVELNEKTSCVASQGVTLPLPNPLARRDGGLKLRLLLDETSMELFVGDGEAVMFVPVEPAYDQSRYIQLHCQRGIIRAASLEVFGLRSTVPTLAEHLLIEASKPAEDTVIYQSKSKSYTIYSHRIEDAVYGEPPAYVPDRDTILSPTRAIEEFAWRKNWANDMTRVIDRGNVWHPRSEIAQLPDLHTAHATIDAAYRLAADVFYRCGSPEFARPGEEGMWTAGQFQGPGEGFGVWVRDTTHIAIRSGNLLDPEGARRSLLFTTKSGFDNGVDGTAMPIVGIWDYYLATGDLTLIQETWTNLKSRIAKLDESFDLEQGLVPADQSTSNDAFPEP